MKRHVLLSSLVLALALVFGPGLASAQSVEGPNRLDEDIFSLSFGVPGGGNAYAPGAFGLWYNMSGLNLGVNIGLGHDSQKIEVGDDTFGTHTWGLLIAPAIKYYLYTNMPVAPYIYGQLNLAMSSQGNSEDAPGDPLFEDPTLSLAGGLGVEWFPVPYFSIAGHTGLGFDLVRPGDDSLRFGTLTSGLSAQIYFK